MMLVKNNIDPPSEERDLITAIEAIKNKITNATIERNKICKRLKKLRQKLHAAERKYESLYGGRRKEQIK